MNRQGDFAEKRQFGRRSTNMRGWIKVAGRPATTCIIKNLSDGGALLESDEDVWLPFSFRLTSACGQVDRVCEIRHQFGQRKFGVEFVEAAIQSTSGSVSRVSENGNWVARETPLHRR